MRRNKLFKKVLSVVLVSAMVITGGSFHSDTARAAAGSGTRSSANAVVTIDNSQWEIYGSYLIRNDTDKITYFLQSDGTAWVSQVDSDSKECTVQASIPFTYAMYDQFFADQSVTTPSPDDYFNKENQSNVTMIMNAALKGCSSLETVKIEDGISKIGKEAFAGCSSLREIYVPDSVNSMGYDVSGPDGAIEADILDAGSNCTIYCSKDSYADSYAKSKNYTVSYIEPNEELVTIEGKNWKIYSDNTVIDEQGIKYLLNENDTNVKVVGYNQPSVSLEDNSCTIPAMIPLTYSVCREILSGKQPDLSTVSKSTVVAIVNEAFKGAALEEIIISADGVKEIGDGAFASCDGLTKLQIPNTVSSFGEKILDGSKDCKVCCWKNSMADLYAQNEGYAIKYMDETTETPDATSAPTAAPTEPAETDVPTPSVSPVTPKPVPTASPAASLRPTNPWLPDGVATSVPATPSPVVTQTPSATVAPDTTEKPSATVTPDVTEAPSVTDAPVQTESPSAAPTDAPNKPEETLKKEGVTYQVDQNKNSVAVSDMRDSKSNNVKIPSTVSVGGKEYPVTEIGKNAFKGNKNLKKVTLGKNVKVIEAGAFKGCQNLSKVKFPAALSTIGKNSFSGCKKLKSVSLSSSLKKIGTGAFKNCKKLTKVKVGKAVKKGILSAYGPNIRYGANSVKLDISASAFENCVNLKQMVINSLVRRIGNSALKNCKSLRSLIVNSKILREVAKRALKGVHNCKISVPDAKLKPYSVLFKNKGQGKKVIVAKI